MIASKLRPFHAAQAKERQGARNDLSNIVEKIPQIKARDEAGKAAGDLTSPQGQLPKLSAMTIQTNCNLAIKYGVSPRSIRRWYTVNRQIEDPLQAAVQFLAETSTADLSRIIEILRTETTTTAPPL